LTGMECGDSHIIELVKAIHEHEYTGDSILEMSARPGYEERGEGM